MRRKSERTASKKAKASPEKKVEKVTKRTRSRRKKQSTSSENESADDKSPTRVEQTLVVDESKPPKTPVKEDSPEEAQDQVWRVKAAEGDVGEIQKLKICLTRPPSTPERVDRSPRSKRKHSRATSSSDTTSVEAPEEKDKRKSRRSKRSHRESKDEPEKNDSQGEEPEQEVGCQENAEDEVTQSVESKEIVTSENTISTSNVIEDNENKESESKDDNDKSDVQSSEDTSMKTDKEPAKDEAEKDKEDKPSDADTTVVSPEAENAVSASSEPESSTQPDNRECQAEIQHQESELSQSHIVPEVMDKDSPPRRRSMSVDKSEILELHAEESKCESDMETDKSKAEDTKEEQDASKGEQVSKIEEQAPIQEPQTSSDRTTNVTGVVESSSNEKRSREPSVDSKEPVKEIPNEKAEENQKKPEHSDSIQSNQEDNIPNGQAAPIVVSRKRRWGSRPKLTSQKSITISTDVLKDIIPDVKPVEFDEVIEDKKNRREVTEKIERPVLPKIVIDNTENVERNVEHKSEHNEKNKEIAKPRESHLAANRKISIIKDNDSIITRPPSPPRHKQSCVLYITNLVRPFTLPQLKNLLQRTGRIVENGFWIDRIKSKCYVVYEKEEQAVETRHALHGVTWPVSNPKTLQVDFSTQEAFEKAKVNEETDNAQVSTIPGTVEDWLREQDLKRERGETQEKPWERKPTREWDLGKNENDKDKEKRREERPIEKRRHRTPERSPEPARKFKKKEEEAPAKLLDDLFKKTKTTPCIYWLPLSAETIAIKEEQRRQHMAEHERRMQEQRRTHRRH